MIDVELIDVDGVVSTAGLSTVAGAVEPAVRGLAQFERLVSCRAAEALQWRGDDRRARQGVGFGMHPQITGPMEHAYTNDMFYWGTRYHYRRETADEA